MVVIVMGVAGAGKSTVGRALADALGYQFRDADEFHSAANVEKMRRGERLDDRDRDPWLDGMAAAIDGWLRDRKGVVLACSALKADYRARLVRAPAEMRVVYLRVPPELARQRVQQRTDHFMPRALVDSQFDALEEPHDAIVVDASQSPEVIVRTIQEEL